MTACDLRIAAIWPAVIGLAAASAAVMSVAYLTTLKGLPFEVHDRVVGGLNPDFLAALADALVLRRLILATVQARPELQVFAALLVGRSTNMLWCRPLTSSKV